MVLASTDPSTTLDNLADMADKIVEVAIPTVAAVSTIHADNSKVKQLREVSRRPGSFSVLYSLPLSPHTLQDTPSCKYTTSQPTPSSGCPLLVPYQIWRLGPEV